MSTVASFHLTRYPARHALGAMAGMVTGDRSLAAVPGLRFARRLGTGAGSRMGLGADLCRWAMFAVWEGEAALDDFLAASAIAAGWDRRGSETWTVRLRPLSARGRWSGARPLDATDATGATATTEGGDGPVAVLTRARIGVRHWPAFYRSVPAVERHLRRQPGLLAVLGVGEAPVGLQATFSLWRSAADVAVFAEGANPHAEVVRRTRTEGWFGEELFARFRPYGSTGTWDGRDPLAALDRRAGGKGS
ncbi:MAG: spheroidene monooxygenase [Acidimicrobiia bacterium]